MISPVLYSFLISAACVLLNCIAVAVFSYSLIKRRNIVAWLFFIAVSISVITSICNLLIACVRMLDAGSDYSLIVKLAYNISVIAEPVALLSLFAGLIVYAIRLGRS